MPFDPNKFMAERQIGTAVAGSAAKFDPQSFMQGRGIQTLPNQGNIENGASTANAMQQPTMAESAGRAAAQGATAGFGDELSAAAGALVPTAMDEAMGRGYADRYAMQRDQLRAENTQAQQAHPVVYALSEILASVPLAIATGGSGEASTASKIGAAGIQGATYGLGKSAKNSVSEAASDAAKSGLLSMGLVGAFSAAKAFRASLPDAGLGSAASESTGESMISSAPKTFFDKNGDYIISYGKGVKDSFAVGKEMQAALANPDVQAQISNELNAQPGQISSVIKATRNKLGTMFDAKLAENPEATGDVSKAFDGTYKKLEDVFSSSDPLVKTSKESLEKYVKQVEENLLSKSPTGTLSEVPLADIAAAQQQLGNVVYKQKAFLRPGTNGVNGAAKSFFGDLASAFQAGDMENGSGGDLANINKALSATYKMEGATLEGATIKALANPRNVAAAKKYAAFVQPLAQLEPGVRDVLTPELHSYLTNDFQKALTKAQILNLVTSGGNAGANTSNTILSLAGLKGMSKALSNDVANRMGAFSSNFSTSGLPQADPSTLSSLARAPAAAMGALSTQPSPQQPSSLGALRPM